MYQQSSAWMFHGLLLDRKEEFFIEPVTITEPLSSPSDGKLPASGEMVGIYIIVCCYHAGEHSVMTLNYSRIAVLFCIATILKIFDMFNFVFFFFSSLF